ncbi:glycosyltransferase [Aromatoleum toluolicum]|uniref:Glycosyl transferase family 28 n=1 Tax=Aromatoleum toluolicum TaxID=90060 RepID=A0ABX1NF88_9RHOO|nr:glycosyl transferase family 28 [Aromatoleum toluolicum]
MIFVTVGTQLAFNRLVEAVDKWAEANSDVEVFGQIGPSGLQPRAMTHADFLPPAKADELMRQADLIVSHAGMGSILTALRYQRPILIMPRKAGLGEHRNDHQFATARWLDGRPGVSVAWSEDEVAARLDERHRLSVGPQLAEFASGQLIERLDAYIRASR